MTRSTIAFVAITAFALGFAVSEFRGYFTQRSDRPLANFVSGSTPNQVLEEVQPTKASVTASEEIKPSQTTQKKLFSWELINQLISSAHYDDAIRLLQEYLAENEKSAQGWYLLAHVYKTQGQPAAAFNAWFRYLKLEVNGQRLDQTLREMKNYAVQLSERSSLFNDDFTWLIAQLDTLLTYNPNDGELHLMMASLSLKLNDTYQAQYHALMAANDPNAQKRAEDILAKLDGKNIAEDISIPLVRFGNQFLINVSVEGSPARLLLDTGASLSGLSSTYTAQYPAMMKSIKPIRLNTASGSQNSFLFTVDNISIGNIVFNQHILAQLPMDNAQGFDGLLGVDILGRFDFVIDQNSAVLKLKARGK